MAKLNEGDVMEGIFAICAALIFAYGEIDKKKLRPLWGSIYKNEKEQKV